MLENWSINSWQYIFGSTKGEENRVQPAGNKRLEIVEDSIHFSRMNNDSTV